MRRIICAVALLWSVLVFALVIIAVVAMPNAHLAPAQTTYNAALLACAVLLALPVLFVGTNYAILVKVRTGDLLLAIILTMPIALLAPLLIATVIGSVAGG